VCGALVPDAQGGMGLDERDLVLLLEETGRAALPAPVVATAAVGAPLLRDAGQLDDGEGRRRAPARGAFRQRRRR
jgi:alkylation response protein AidB-like acyl-CoA dehydrogenase